MLDLLRAVARLFHKHIGWNRLGVVISLAIIGVALYVLTHMLRDIDVNEVIRAVKATQWTHVGAAAPKEVERQVVAVSFDTKGRVSNVERFGLEDGQVVALSRRVTDSNIKGVGLIQQLMGNLGRINPGQFLRQGL